MEIEDLISTKLKKMFDIIKQDQGYTVRNGKIIIHFDKDGNLRIVEIDKIIKKY